MAQTREELEDIAKEVVDLELAIREWEKACDRAATLRKLVDQYKMPLNAPDRPAGSPIPSDAPMLAATETLLDRGDAVDTGSAAAALATELGDQITAFREWVDAWVLVTATGAAYEQLDEKDLTVAERLVLREHHPDNLIHGFLWPARDLRHMRDLRVLERARETYGLLRGMASSYGGLGTMAADERLDAAVATDVAGGAAADLAPTSDKRPAEGIFSAMSRKQTSASTSSPLRPPSRSTSEQSTATRTSGRSGIT